MEIPQIGYGYKNVVSKHELKTDEKVFQEALKQARKSEVKMLIGVHMRHRTALQEIW